MIQFNNKRGLCAAITTMYSSNWKLEMNVLQELNAQFSNAGLPRLYPFNVYRYIEHKNSGTQHMCPQRLAWVRDHIMYPPADQSKELTEFYIAWHDWATAGIPTGYAMYYPGENGEVLHKRCTKEEYEEAQRINQAARPAKE